MSNPVIRSDRVEGTAVYNPKGDKLGSIEHLVIDKRSGHVRWASLEFGGFLGLGTDRYPLPWHLLKYEPAMDGYVVPLTQDSLEKAPKQDKASTADTTEEYGRKVYDHYGVAWY